MQRGAAQGAASARAGTLGAGGEAEALRRGGALRKQRRRERRHYGVPRRLRRPAVLLAVAIGCSFVAATGFHSWLLMAAGAGAGGGGGGACGGSGGGTGALAAGRGARRRADKHAGDA
eukprot:SAG11_NODE_1543_length_4716_cov_6.357375_1_plen_117_part_10